MGPTGPVGTPPNTSLVDTSCASCCTNKRNGGNGTLYVVAKCQAHLLCIGVLGVVQCASERWLVVARHQPLLMCAVLHRLVQWAEVTPFVTAKPNSKHKCDVHCAAPSCLCREQMNSGLVMAKHHAGDKVSAVLTGI